MVKTKLTSKPTPEKDPKGYMRFYGLAIELVIMNVGLIFGGYYLDQYLHTNPAAILLGTFLAMAGSIFILIKALK